MPESDHDTTRPRYARQPRTSGAPMKPNPDVARQAAHALALSPSRDVLLEPWGLRYGDVKAANIGIDKQALTIPFHTQGGELVAVKLRHLSGEADKRFSWLNSGKAPAIYFPTHHTTLGDEVVLCEGPLKALALQVLLGRPVLALASGVQTGIPEEGCSLFADKRVLYIGDPDEEGQRGPAILARQLKGIASELRTISFPDATWGTNGVGESDVNDLLRALRKQYGDQVTQVLPGVAAHILGRLEASPDLLLKVSDEGAPVETRLNAGDHDLPRISAATWDIIKAANGRNPILFRYVNLISWIEKDQRGFPIVRPLYTDEVRHCLARLAEFYVMRPDRENKKELIPVPALPPIHLVKDLLAQPNPPLPALTRIVHTPIFAADGTLHETPGYNPAAETFYAPAKGFTVPAVPVIPSDTERHAAHDLIVNELLGDFPFEPATEKAHAIALLLQPFVREMIAEPTPLYLVSKPQAGTGASLLVELISRIVTGQFAVMTAGKTEEEMRKRMTAMLLTGTPLIIIDNLNVRLQSSDLSAAMTTDQWEDRLLGQTKIVRVPVRCAWAATGNNPSVSGEIARRSVRVRLDAKIERPWQRTAFRHPQIRDWVEENRGKLVGAVLVLIQAWIAEGQPKSPVLLGGFTRWAEVIGGILSVAGIPGFLGNLEAFYAEADTETAALSAFVQGWWKVHQEDEVGVADLWLLTEGLDLDLGDGTDRSQKTRLGKRLADIHDRRFNIEVESEKWHLVTLVKGGVTHKAQQWKLGVVPAAGTMTP